MRFGIRPNSGIEPDRYHPLGAMCAGGRVRTNIFGRSAPYLVSVCLIACGCGDPQQARRLDAARRDLQINRPQQAIDVLVKDSSPEGHYLRGVALYRLAQLAPAEEQIRAALRAKPDVPKYKGFELLLRLAQKDREAGNELISLYVKNRSSGALALFVTSAYTTQGEMQSALAAFDASLTLTADAPEFMFEMLKHAIKTGRAAPAHMLIERIADAAPDDVELMRVLLQMSVQAQLGDTAKDMLARLEALSPSDPELAKQRVHVLSLVNKKDDAIRAAQQMYEEGSPNEESAMIYAYALSQADPTPDREKALHQLALKYPRNLEILVKYAIYLARAKRLSAALDVLNSSIQSQTVKVHRDHLIQATIALCLSSGDADAADTEIGMYRNEINDPLLLTYFEGRVLYLRKEYGGALVKFRYVLDHQKDATGTQRSLAADTLTWMRKILADKQAQWGLQGVVKRVPQEEPSDAPSSGEDGNQGETGTQPEETAPKPETPAQAPQ